METTNLARAVELSMLPESDQNIDTEEELTQDLTVVEFAAHNEFRFPKYEPQASRLTRVLTFLLSPYNPRPLSHSLLRYLKDVRRRMVESSEYDRIHYSHTLYQKLRRGVEKSIQHVKTNLRS
jgi:hypothetical protein